MHKTSSPTMNCHTRKRLNIFLKYIPFTLFRTAIKETLIGYWHNFEWGQHLHHFWWDDILETSTLQMGGSTCILRLAVVFWVIKKEQLFFRDVKHEKLVLNYKIKKIYVPVLRILTYGKIFLFLFVRGSNKLCRNVSLFINLHALHYFYKIVYTQIKC